MNCEELKSRLDAAACSTANYSIGTRENDTFCLEQFDGDWWVFYTERGIVNDPEFRSASEAEACAYLWEKMQHIRHDHLVGLFTNLPRAQDMARTLEQLGLAHHIDPIPSTTPRSIGCLSMARQFLPHAAISRTCRSGSESLPGAIRKLFERSARPINTQLLIEFTHATSSRNNAGIECGANITICF